MNGCRPYTIVINNSIIISNTCLNRCHYKMLSRQQPLPARLFIKGHARWPHRKAAPLANTQTDWTILFAITWQYTYKHMISKMHKVLASFEDSVLFIYLFCWMHHSIHTMGLVFITLLLLKYGRQGNEALDLDWILLSVEVCNKKNL